MSLIYIILSLFFFILYYYYTKDLFHPGAIFLSIWFMVCSISCVDLDDYMAPWCFEMYVVTLLSGFSFFVGSLFFLRKDKFVFLRPVELSYTFNFVVKFLFIVCFACALLEWVNAGALFALSLDNIVGDVKSQIDGDIPGVHYGTIYFPYVAILLYFRYLNKKNGLDLFLITLIIFYSIFLKMSRGDMMIYIFSFTFLYSRYYKLKLKRFVFLFIVFISVVCGFMLFRVSETSVVLNSTSNPYFSIFYSYIATCFANLNDYIIESNSYHLNGNLTFSPLWTMFGQKDSIVVILKDQIGIFNAVPYLYGFYHDFKLIGIIIFPFLYGFLISVLYHNSIYSNVYWILPLAVLQKALFVSFFGNYFAGELVILYPHFFTLFIVIFVSYLNITKIKIIRK